MIYFVYITTNLINGKQYVGDHHAINLSNDNYYIGSGKLISKAIKKYKRENFNRKILEIFNTKKEAFNAQEKYIIEYNTLIPNGYNISPTGGLGVIRCLTHTKATINKIKKHHKGFNGRKHTVKSIEKMSLNHRGGVKQHSEKTKQKMKINSIGKNKGKIPWNKGLKMSKDFCDKTAQGIKEKRSKNENYLNRRKNK